MSDTSNKQDMNRITKVLEHKLNGKSTREISKLLKISHTTVQRDYKKGIELAFNADVETINFQRNKITATLNKILDRQLKYAVGYTERKSTYLGHVAVYDPEEEEYDKTLVDKEGIVYTSEQHMYLEDHFPEDEDEDPDGYMNCDCKVKMVKKSAKEIARVKEEWQRENTRYVQPDKESIKVVLEICKQLATLWGANIPTGTPTIFDQRKQTIQIGDNDNEE